MKKTQDLKTQDARQERSPLVGWLINAGLDDMTGRIKQMTGSPEDIDALRQAITAEEARMPQHQRSTRLKPLRAKLKSYEGKADPYALKPRTAVLLDARKALDGLRQVIAGHEDAFMAATLPSRLKMGLHCLRAHMVWVLPDPSNRGQGRKVLTIKSRRDVISPEGFEGWLTSEVTWLKKPTAYKYMNALKGLGLDHTSSEADVDKALAKQLAGGPCNLKMLCDAAVDGVKPQLPGDGAVQTEFDFLKDNLHDFATQAANILSIADQLKAIPQMHKAACARVYGMLRELTGTDWQPSDTPDALCEIDPDTIDL